MIAKLALPIFLIVGCVHVEPLTCEQACAMKDKKCIGSVESQSVWTGESSSHSCAPVEGEAETMKITEAKKAAESKIQNDKSSNLWNAVLTGLVIGIAFVGLGL